MSGNELFNALRKRKDEDTGEKGTVLNINKTWENEIKKDGFEPFAEDAIRIIKSAVSAKDSVAGLYEAKQNFGKLEQRVLEAFGECPLISEIKEYINILNTNIQKISYFSRIASDNNTDPMTAGNCWNERDNYIKGTKVYMENNTYRFIKYKKNVFKKE